MIEIRSLSKRFHDRQVLNDISLTVKKNSAHILMGPSGSGKSTLLKCVAGLISPDQGIVSLGSKKTGMLFQKNALFDSLNLLENLVFPRMEVLRCSRPEAETAARQMLAEVELHTHAEAFPDEISGGMQKRLGIARALIVEPEIILYDEPTAGLDPITSRMIADLILRLKHEHQATLLIVTSDVARAQQLGDDITLLVQGEAIPAGPATQILKHTDPRVKQFVHGRTQGPLTHVDSI